MGLTRLIKVYFFIHKVTNANLYIRHMIPGIIIIPISALTIIKIKPKLLGLLFASTEKCV